MQFSIREAKAKFARATKAAANGEKVVITKHGKPFVELVPAKTSNIDWDKLDRVIAEMGLDQDDYAWPPEFDDPAFTRLAMGLKD